MAERIVIGSIVFTCPEQPDAPVAPLNNPAREWKQLCVIGTADAVKAAFVNDITYHHEWDSAVFDETGTQTGTEIISEDLSDYCIAGDVVDHRDGNITVYMGKMTDLEQAYELLYGGVQ